jgi:hypothetical protein
MSERLSATVGDDIRGTITKATFNSGLSVKGIEGHIA